MSFGVNRSWKKLFAMLDGLEFGETWFEPAATFAGMADFGRSIAWRYSRESGRHVRGLTTQQGMLFVRIDHAAPAEQAPPQTPATAAGGGGSA